MISSTSSMPRSQLIMIACRRNRRVAERLMLYATNNAIMTRPSTAQRFAFTSTSSKTQKALHSSAQPQHSALIAGHGLPNAGAATTSANGIPAPQFDQLKTLFIASAIPMVGFGFMDNLVMIQAGQFIDGTLGVTMGLATMTAAAAGQVVSDVSGVVFGGSLERFLHRFGLIQQSTLTAAQRGLPVCRNVALLGAVIGVACGCGLGATCLLFMDLEARERIERARKLHAVLSDMMDASHETHTNDNNSNSSSNDDKEFHCDSCTIHLAHEARNDFTVAHAKPDSNNHNNTTNNNNSRAKIDFLPDPTTTSSSLALGAAMARRSLRNDKGTVLCMPVFSQSEPGEVVAVLEFHNTKRPFTADDERSSRLMARHIAIFMERLSSD